LRDFNRIRTPRGLTANVISECFKALNSLFVDDSIFKIQMGARSRAVVEDIRWQSVRPYATEVRRANFRNYEVLVIETPDTRNGGQVVQRPMRPADIAAFTLNRPIQTVPVLRIVSAMAIPATSPPNPRLPLGEHRLIVKCSSDRVLNLEDFARALPPQPETLDVFGGVVARTDTRLRRFMAFVKKVNLQALAFLPCPHVTVARCLQSHGGQACADRYHFNRLFNAYTRPAYGDCTFLSSCFSKDICRYIHYEWVRPANPLTYEEIIQLPHDLERDVRSRWGGESGTVTEAISNLAAEVKDNVEDPAQWIRADLERFNFRVIGKFDVVMIDRKYFRLPLSRVCG